MDKQKSLKGYHVVFLVQNTMLGTGLLSLPQRLSPLGYSEAFFPLFFGVVATLNLWPMIWLISKFPNENLFRINEILLGKGIGKTINLFLVLHFTLFLAAIIGIYMQLIQTTALQEQKITLPVIFFLLLLLYIVNGGIKHIARFCTLGFFIGLPMLYATRWIIPEGEITHLVPLFNYSLQDFLVATKDGYLSILGYELIMFFYPFIDNKKRAFKHAAVGLWITIVISTIVTVLSVMYFSEWQLKNVEFSVLHLFKSGEFSFLERVDILGVTLWVILVLTTTSTYLWCAVKGIESFRSVKKSYHAFFLAIIIFVIISIPISHELRLKIYDISNYAAYFLLVWPIVLILVYSLRKKKVQNSEQ